jgi:hypothetical protein
MGEVDRQCREKEPHGTAPLGGIHGLASGYWEYICLQRLAAVTYLFSPVCVAHWRSN